MLKPLSKILVLFCLIAAFPVLAKDAPTLTKPKIIVPDHIPGVDTLTAEDLIERAGSVAELIIIDSRIRADRIHGYIEGSVSLPDIETSCPTLKEIIPTKDSPVLFYCNGVKCGRSIAAIRIAKTCGYRTMSWFRGGFEEWNEKGYQIIGAH